MAIREVIEGSEPSPHDSVRAALGLLHEGRDSLRALRQELAQGLEGGLKDVRTDRYTRLLHATDASIYEMEPLAVVYPRSERDVQHVVSVASRRGLPLLPRGGATSLAGQGVNHAIALDFTVHMDRILEINAAEGWARVEPGVVLSELNRAARPHGLQYPIDPSTVRQATIGGGIGNNSCGARSVIYGKTIDTVRSLRVVLSDGTAAQFEPVAGEALAAKMNAAGLEGDLYRETRRIVDESRDEIDVRYPNVMRRVSGYNLDAMLDAESMDLSRLIVGSEGTLGVVSEAVVSLAPVPAAKGLAAVHFGSVVEAAEATVAALEHGPSAVEMVDDSVIDRCRASAGYASLADFVEGAPGALLLIEFYAGTVAEAESKLDALRNDFTNRNVGYAIVTTTDPARQQRMWRMREAGLGLLMSIRGDAKPVAFVEDAAVPPEHLAGFVARFDELAGRYGFSASHYGHASVGCLHIRPLVSVKDADELQRMKRLASDVADLALEFGGSLSGEHGDGILRGVFTERMFGPKLTDVFRQLKRAFDPQGILNPGKIIDTPAFDDNLRLSPATVNRQPPTHLDFTFEGGLARAAEQCNGQGVCRKFEGAMCPSYMVTKDEEHSTRGRANLLRQVLNGALPEEDLAGDGIHEALDLCVECKACKAECPSGVDMAKLKFEVLTKRHEAHGTPLRSRLFAHISAASRLGSFAPAIANGVSGSPIVRRLLHATLGIHRDRPLPRLASEPLPRWFARRRRRDQAEAPAGEAVFFHDTFNDYYHPEAGRAAVHVMEALGYRVRLVKRQACCGRPAISKGMLPLAAKWAARNIEALRPYAERGVPIVGIEPSCLLTLRDEYPELVSGEAARSVAAQALMLEELVTRRLSEGGPGIFRDDVSRRVLLHGHCHQKALAGMDATLRALSLAGYAAELIDSPCCGMAGSFGFEKEHYGISKDMGAYRLFPAVESAPPDAEIAITGVSCRQQISHFTDRRPRHIAELLADALRDR